MCSASTTIVSAICCELANCPVSIGKVCTGPIVPMLCKYNIDGPLTEANLKAAMVQASTTEVDILYILGQEGDVVYRGRTTLHAGVEIRWK